MIVVYFWNGEPSMHCAKVMKRAPHFLARCCMHGICHKLPCSDSVGSNVIWLFASLLHAGFSSRKDPRALYTPSSIAVQRATTAFASCTSRLCLSGMSGRPMMCVRVRTSGGPLSSLLGPPWSKNLLMLNVEHGGAAKTARKRPLVVSDRRDLKKKSFKMLCLWPPPQMEEPSISATLYPKLVRAAVKPSERKYGPENKFITVRDEFMSLGVREVAGESLFLQGKCCS